MKEEFIECGKFIIRLASIGIGLGACFSLCIVTAKLISKIFIKVEPENKEK